MDNTQEIPEDPINDSGYMYRTQYFILDRTMMEAMPIEWQKKWVSLIDEAVQEFDIDSDNWVDLEYLVKPKDDKGRYITNPWGPYKYPNKEYIESVRKKYSHS